MQDFRYDVYLAGPFFTDDQKLVMDEAKKLLMSAGLVVCDPREISPVITDASEEERKNLKMKAIFDGNILGMMHSFAILACIDDRDTGTSFELGFMYAMTAVSDATMRPEGPRITFSAKGYGCNVMLSESVHGHYSTLDELKGQVHSLGRHIKGRTDGTVLRDHGFFTGELAHAVE